MSRIYTAKWEKGWKSYHHKECQEKVVRLNKRIIKLQKQKAKVLKEFDKQIKHIEKLRASGK